MKIVMLTTSPIDIDSRILNEAASLGAKHQLTILTRQYDTKPTLKKTNFQVKRIAYLKLWPRKLNIFSSLWALTRAAFQEDPDVYHAHDLDGLLCAYLPALVKRKTLIYDSHELWSGAFPHQNLAGIQWLLAPLERLLMAKVARGITVNDSITRVLKQKYQKNFLSLLNVPILKSSPTKIHLRQMFPGEIIILHLGAMAYGRGIEQIIAAAALLPAGFKIVFLGASPANQYNQIILDRHLEKKIAILPAVPPEEILSAVKEADLGLALTQKASLSFYYSSPNKIFQYLAAGVPILGSSFPEFKKIIIDHQIGETVNPSHPKDIAQKILAMTKSVNQKKYRQNLAGLSSKQYNWTIESKKLLKFYREL